jgi:hypothetical protein
MVVSLKAAIPPKIETMGPSQAIDRDASVNQLPKPPRPDPRMLPRKNLVRAQLLKPAI